MVDQYPTPSPSEPHRRPPKSTPPAKQRRRLSVQDLAPLPLRLMLGVGFLYHGLPKVFSAQEREQFTGMLQGIGVPLPEVMAWVVGLLEVGGALALLAGFLVPVFSGLLIIHMLVAMFTVHWPHGFNFINIVGTTAEGPVFGMPGIEVNLLYIAMLLALLLWGPGAFATTRKREYVGERAPPTVH